MRPDEYDAATDRILETMDRLRPTLMPAGVDWILDTESVQFLIETTPGSSELATELNELAAHTIWLWSAEEDELGRAKNAPVRQWVLALKTASAILGQTDRDG